MYSNAPAEKARLDVLSSAQMLSDVLGGLLIYLSTDSSINCSSSSTRVRFSPKTEPEIFCFRRRFYDLGGDVMKRGITMVSAKNTVYYSSCRGHIYSDTCTIR